MAGLQERSIRIVPWLWEHEPSCNLEILLLTAQVALLSSRLPLKLRAAPRSSARPVPSSSPEVHSPLLVPELVALPRSRDWAAHAFRLLRVSGFQARLSRRMRFCNDVCVYASSPRSVSTCAFLCSLPACIQNYAHTSKLQPLALFLSPISCAYTDGELTSDVTGKFGVTGIAFATAEGLSHLLAFGSSL